MPRRSLVAAVLALGLLTILASAVLLISGGRRDSASISTDAAAVTEEPPNDRASVTVQPPVALKGILRVVMPRLDIDAPTVVLGVDKEGTMEAPARPMEVGWYNFSSLPNGGSNIVMSGHVDFASFGPAVFWRLREVRADDVVQLLLDDQSVVNYRVASIESYDANAAPVQAIVGPTAQETITLITCSGFFDSRTRQYSQRLIIRAVRASG